MLKGITHWSYNNKVKLAEFIYLTILSVIIPLSVGLQIFDHFSFTLSYIFLNLLQIPVILLFYRWVLPKTLFNKRIWLFFAALPIYFVIYELNARLAYFIATQLPIIPRQYQENLLSAQPFKWTGRLIQNIDYTLLILLSSIGVVFIRELFKRQHIVDELRSDKLQLELEQLKSQVQPHFFFNTLNNLYSLSLQGSPKTSVTIANLSAIMRYVLYEAREEKVLLAKEIAFLHSYIDLERIRHSDENLIQFGVQGNPNGILIEPLIFLPLIENCFKHSLAYKIPGNQVQIMMTIDEDEITLQTANLVVMKSEQVTMQGGIGLQNVRKRLELLYPGHHQLSVVEENGQFIITVNIHLTTQ
ncbi:MAG: sensor histidine kinase [Chitinophagaceae bacterium]|nr:sensor histidine kinase [Chitinophagaceae bacterium]